MDVVKTLKGYQNQQFYRKREKISLAFKNNESNPKK
jgi:hypothetical protein